MTIDFCFHKITISDYITLFGICHELFTVLDAIAFKAIIVTIFPFIVFIFFLFQLFFSKYCTGTFFVSHTPFFDK